MKLNSKGQVTIPADLRRKHHLYEGDEVVIVEDGTALLIMKKPGSETRGQRLVREMSGRATKRDLSTDELMKLMRGE